LVANSFLVFGDLLGSTDKAGLLVAGKDLNLRPLGYEPNEVGVAGSSIRVFVVRPEIVIDTRYADV
jgi:hypothetical protein